MFMGYCILGGIVFEYLEKENELQVHNTSKMQVKHVTLTQVKREMAKNRQLLEYKIWNVTKSSPVLREEIWTADVMAEMKKFEKNCNGHESMKIVHRWTNNQNICRTKGWDGHKDLDSRFTP